MQFSYLKCQMISISITNVFYTEEPESGYNSRGKIGKYILFDFFFRHILKYDTADLQV